MGLIVIDAKIKFKRSTIPGVVPVIGVSDDHTDGSWTDNMIYPGELFVNIPDQRVWIGVTAAVIEIFNASTSFPLGLADQTIPVGYGERIVTLSGDSGTDALSVYNRSGQLVASFMGDQNTVINKTLFVDDSLQTGSGALIGGTLNAANLVTSGTLGVNGAVNMYSTLDVSALATFLAGVNVTGNATVSGDLLGNTNVWANRLNGYVFAGQQVGTISNGAIYALDAVRTAGNFRFLFETSATTMNASTSLAFQTSNATRMTINATDAFTASGHKMGIGKGSAAHSVLEVQGSTADKLQLVNANTSLGINDNTVVANSGNWTITLPNPVGIQGRKYTIVNVGRFVTQVVSVGREKINGDATWFLPFDGAYVIVESNGTSWTVVGCKQRSTLNVVVSTAGATFQHNELLGARSISLIIRGGSLNQGPFTFNSTTGTITTTVAVSDKLTVFYNPQ